ncbi:hypothetical protein CKAH01_06196 [Colletotrichum kahawae]|uniref:Uncharacterized protein n=1 Tax=Colletotrichum kahawae TaxID=34407 RepID=A0AAE0D651_COLKA|nr:hypothetical protein CKAH01_06196 [Colletotrichum kahawae]
MHRSHSSSQVKLCDPRRELRTSPE